MIRFTSAKKRSGILRPILSTLILFGVLTGIFVSGISSVSESAEENYTESLRLAILRSAVHCYAMEGRYPESLDYLREHYGIRWNEDEYVVDYDITGSNLRPDVTIIPLNRKEES